MGNDGPRRLHALAKLLITVLYIILTISVGRYDPAALLPMLIYPLWLSAWAAAPQKLLLSRFALALPFVLAAALANILIETAPAFRIGEVVFSYGLLSAVVLVLKCYLCVTALLLLIACTPLSELGRSLRLLHTPSLLVDLLLLTYRYLSILLGQARDIYLAYCLRSARGRGVEWRHLGSLAGVLLLSSFDRAERLYQAMLCRGYSGSRSLHEGGRPWRAQDSLYTAAICAALVLLRFGDIPGRLAALVGA